MSEAAKKVTSPLTRWLKRLLVVILVLYVLICITYACFQRRIIYLPRHFTAEQVDKAAKNYGLERWTNASGQAIGMKRVLPGAMSAGRVLLVYGNASWSVGCAHYATDIQSAAPFDVFILEYPGYADRAGSPTEQTLFHAADEAVQLLGTNQPIYIVGESLGSGVASYLAGTYPDCFAGLMLLSPYDRLASVGEYRLPFLPVPLLLADPFPSADYLRNYHGPVGVMLDGKDRVVPERFGQRLFDGYDGPKQLWRFPEGHHINIGEPPPKFWGEVAEFWRTNPISRAVSRN